MTRDLISIPEAARLCGADPKTFRRRMERGEVTVGEKPISVWRATPTAHPRVSRKQIRQYLDGIRCEAEERPALVVPEF